MSTDKLLTLDSSTDRVGIGISNPKTKLDVQGDLSVGSSSNATISFDDIIGVGLETVARIKALPETTNGGKLEFHTRESGILTERLTIGEAGDWKLNGSSYGSSGAVLTSNGEGNAVSWDRPYLLRVFLSTSQTISSSSWNTPEKLINFTIDNDITTTNASSNFDTDDKWTPPAGVYLVNLQTTCKRSGGNIFRVWTGLYKNGNYIRQSRFENENNSDGADIINYTLQMSDFIYTDGTDYYEIKVGGGTPAGNNWHVEGDSIGTTTFFKAYKVL